MDSSFLAVKSQYSQKKGEKAMNATNSALIMMGLQNDLMPDGAIGVLNGDRVLSPIIRLIQRDWDVRVLCQELHWPNHISFVTQHPGKKVGDMMMVQTDPLQDCPIPHKLEPPHCVIGSSGHLFHKSIYNLGCDLDVVQLGADLLTDNRSAFFDKGRRLSTGLHDILKRRGVTKIFICGLPAEDLVLKTAIDALVLFKDYKVFVIEDACCFRNQYMAEATMRLITKRGGRLIESSRLI